jgi:YggT family protein
MNLGAIFLHIASFQSQLADFLESVLFVYTLCILGWIVVSLIFSLGMRVPYSRVMNAILDFLRDVSEPYLRVFRKMFARFGLRAGPLDFSPIVALLVLQFGGTFLVKVVQSV